jgi:hypothetical protein
MNQVRTKTAGSRTAIQDSREFGTEFGPVTRSLTVASRCSAAAMVNSATAEVISSISLAAVRPPEKLSCTEPAPVWLAALRAVGCQAWSNGLDHEVGWHAVAGRAVYTNFGRHPESIEPLGVYLPAGATLAVHWAPGETAYTLEVYSDTEKCA